MNTKKIIDCERKGFDKMVNYRLPHKFMAIGIGIVLMSFALMILRKVGLDGDTEWLKELLKKTFLIGMLFMSVSRDKDEDEMTIMLRAQSYAIAFVIGVVYALVMPYIDYWVSNAIKPEGEALKDLGGFQVLVFMLMVQLMFYHFLKRYR